MISNPMSKSRAPLSDQAKTKSLDMIMETTRRRVLSEAGRRSVEDECKRGATLVASRCRI